MSQKPMKDQQKQVPHDKDSATARQDREEHTANEHHVPGADGPSGAEAEEDNNP